MSSNENIPSTSISSALPLHTTSSSNYASAQSAKAEQDKLSPVTVKMPDGRRNSCGEPLPSPVETWKPNFARQQSWNQEDLKRKHAMSQIEKELEKGEGKTGFTESKRS